MPVALGLALTLAVLATGWFVGSAVFGHEAGGDPTTVSQASATATSTLPPTPAPTPTPTAAPTDTPIPTPTASPTPSPSPTAPARAPFQIDIYKKGTFVSQMDRHSCTAGATQNMLNLILEPDLTVAFQKQISTLLIMYTSTTDSHNGGYGPLGWAKTMTVMSGYKYKLLIEPTMQEALRQGAIALRKTNHPVGLLAWHGAHSWVMTGFQSNADPLYFARDFTVKGAYIVDPFYPRISTYPGHDKQTLPPDSYRDPKPINCPHPSLRWRRKKTRAGAIPPFIFIRVDDRSRLDYT